MRRNGESAPGVLSFLASVPLFADLSESSLLSLAQQCTFQDVEKGDILFLQSDTSDAAYIVRQGSISIVLHSSDGREMVISEMHTGDLLGELGILTKKSHSTSAIARTKSEVLVIPGRLFRRIIENEHKIALRLLELIAERLQISGQRESALAFMDAQARLARLLLELEEQEHDKGYVTVSQDELAQRAGLIRQTVAKALGKWRRAGWLITGRGRILILNRKALEDLKNNLVV
ncbi:MAG TPA: Crp/Fnr family transcriptional regulator [Anaerolineales bacterium]|nr:Crp/Fnr family transcriptional regulator [Anaerolineales bacterium]